MIEWLFTFLVVYLLYKLVFDFIVPVYRTSSQMHSKINQMHQQQQQKSSYTAKDNKETKPRPPAEDYIDYEEIK